MKFMASNVRPSSGAAVERAIRENLEQYESAQIHLYRNQPGCACRQGATDNHFELGEPQESGSNETRVRESRGTLFNASQTRDPTNGLSGSNGIGDSPSDPDKNPWGSQQNPAQLESSESKVTSNKDTVLRDLEGYQLKLKALNACFWKPEDPGREVKLVDAPAAPKVKTNPRSSLSFLKPVNALPSFKGVPLISNPDDVSGDKRGKQDWGTLHPVQADPEDLEDHSASMNLGEILRSLRNVPVSRILVGRKLYRLGFKGKKILTALLEERFGVSVKRILFAPAWRASCVYRKPTTEKLPSNLGFIVLEQPLPKDLEDALKEEKACEVCAGFQNITLSMFKRSKWSE